MPTTICCRRNDLGPAPARLFAVALIASLSAACAERAPSAAERIRPQADAVVVHRSEPGAGEMAALQRALADRPDDVDLAVTLATGALHRHAATGDARWLGMATGAIAAWRSESAPSPAIGRLRVRVLQAEHRFVAAGEQAETFLALQPADAELRLLAADAWRRAGRTDKARVHCLGLGLAGSDALARLCVADVLLAEGDAEGAFDAAAAVATDDLPDPELRAFALAVRAETAAAAGHTEAARAAWRHALAAQTRTVLAYELAYADLLLAVGDPGEVLDRLAHLPDADGVLLRRTLAAQASEDPRAAEWRATLADRFAAAEALGGDDRHLRERALFALLVERQPERALAYARRNWDIQKGPEDAALLNRAARAAGRPGAAAELHARRQDVERAR